MSGGPSHCRKRTHIDKYPIKSKKQLLNLLKTKKGGILIEGKFENGVKGYFGFGL